MFLIFKQQKYCLWRGNTVFFNLRRIEGRGWVDVGKLTTQPSTNPQWAVVLCRNHFHILYMKSYYTFSYFYLMAWTCKLCFINCFKIRINPSPIRLGGGCQSKYSTISDEQQFKRLCLSEKHFLYFVWMYLQECEF